jgi:hypothetical protein
MTEHTRHGKKSPKTIRSSSTGHGLRVVSSPPKSDRLPSRAWTRPPDGCMGWLQYIERLNRGFDLDRLNQGDSAARGQD